MPKMDLKVKVKAYGVERQFAAGTALNSEGKSYTVYPGTVFKIPEKKPTEVEIEKRKKRLALMGDEIGKAEKDYYLENEYFSPLWMKLVKGDAEPATEAPVAVADQQRVADTAKADDKKHGHGRGSRPS